MEVLNQSKAVSRTLIIGVMILAHLLGPGETFSRESTVVIAERIAPRAEIAGVLERNFKEYELFALDPAVVNQKVRNEAHDFVLQLGDERWELHLKPYEMRTEGYVQMVNGIPTGERGQCPTFRGSEGSSPTSKVLALLSDELISIHVADGEEEWYLEPLNVALKKAVNQNLYVRYKQSATDKTNHPDVGSQKLNIDVKSADHNNSEKQSMTSSCEAMLQTIVATDLDFAAFQQLGFSVSGANNYALGIINGVSMLYEDAVNVTFQVSVQNVWNSIAQPWPVVAADYASGVLSSFDGWWSANLPYAAYNRSTTILFTGKDLMDDLGDTTTVGLSQQSQLCVGYNINELKSNAFTQRFQVAHQVGHNFSALQSDADSFQLTWGPFFYSLMGPFTSPLLVYNFSQASMNKIRTFAETMEASGNGCFAEVAFVDTITALETNAQVLGGFVAGAHILSLETSNVETSDADGPIVIDNAHSGLTWVGEEHVILKRGFKAPSNPNADFTLKVDQCQSNDFCGNAINIACGVSINGTTTGTTADLSLGSCATDLTTAGGVWYKIVGDGSLITASLCGSSYDTKIGVFTGTCIGLICITGDDDFCGGGAGSQVSFPSLLGTDYYIYVTGWAFLTGEFNLSVSCSPVAMQKSGENPETEAEPANTMLKESISKTSIYPNPFHDQTTIVLDLKGEEQVTVQIFDVLGKQVAVLANNETMTHGQHQLIFHNNDHSADVFYCRIAIGDDEVVEKMVKLR